MKMLNIIISIILPILVLLYLGGMNIQISPFKISFDYIERSVAWFFLIMGMSILTISHDYRSGKKYYTKGYSDCIKDVKEHCLKDEQNKSKSN